MKKSILIFLLIINGNGFSQTKEEKPFTCAEINSIFSDRHVLDFFHHYKFMFRDTAILVDTFKVFNCDKFSFLDRQVTILHSFTKEISYFDRSTSHLRNVDKTYLVFINMKRKRKRYEFEMWEPLSNGVAKLTIVRRHKPRVRIKFDGSF